jgi:hypothetical protein
MARDFEAEARREVGQNDAAKQWMKDRVETLHSRVTAYDVLSRFNVSLKYGGQREEQISCPFHGKDNKPSARFYPETVKGPSGVWCFVCQQRWDCIKLWQKFSAHEGRFGSLLRDIELSFGITPPEAPSVVREKPVDEEAEEILRMFAAAERRLLSAVPAFKALGDMRGFLAIGSVIDQLRFQMERRSIQKAKARDILRKVLDKIGEKERSCPGV